MMKIIRFSFFVALIALITFPVSSFAEETAAKPAPAITWNAWGRAIFAPLVSDNAGETVPRDAASWGWDSVCRINRKFG
jgi:hypothetical protein